MAQSLTLPLIGVLALVGVGAGVQLGHAAVGEINPMYFSSPATRFHSDLGPYRPSGVAPPLVSAEANHPGVGTACLGCRAFPEEYFPVHEASVDRYSSGYAAEAEVGRAVQPEPAVEVDPNAERLRGDIERVQLYARGSQAEPMVVLASAVEPSEQLVAEEAAETE